MNYLISGLLIYFSLSEVSSTHLTDTFKSRSSMNFSTKEVTGPLSQSSKKLRLVEEGNAEAGTARSSTSDLRTSRADDNETPAVDTDDVFINRLLQMDFFQRNPHMAMLLQTYKGSLSERDKMRISMNIIDQELVIYDRSIKFWQFARFVAGTCRNVLLAGKIGLAAAGQWFAHDPNLSNIFLKITLAMGVTEIGCNMLCDYSDQRVDKRLMENLFRCTERDGRRAASIADGRVLSKKGLAYVAAGRLMAAAGRNRRSGNGDNSRQLSPQDAAPAPSPSPSPSSSNPFSLVGDATAHRHSALSHHTLAADAAHGAAASSGNIVVASAASTYTPPSPSSIQLPSPNASNSSSSAALLPSLQTSQFSTAALTPSSSIISTGGDSLEADLSPDDEKERE